MFSERGWLSGRAPDRKIAGSSPGRSDGRFFFSMVNFCFVCYFCYPFHFRVSAVARTSSWSFCQKCRCQVTAKHTCTLYRYVAWNKVTIRRCYVVLGSWRGGDSSVLITVFFPMEVGYERCLWPQKGGNSSVLNTVFPHGSGVFEGVCGHREEGTAMY